MELSPDEVLAPRLYRRLQEVFGTVLVANPGEPWVTRVTVRWTPRGARKELEVVHGGEYYRVCCPFCSDTRHRLWICHRFGSRDPLRPRRRLTWLAICYNERCFEDKKRLEWLDRVITGQGQVEMPVRKVYGHRSSDTLRRMELPKGFVPLRELPSGHRARRYLADDRRFDPDWLDEVYGVGFAEGDDPRWPEARGRIIIPIRMEGRLVGWQGRWPGPTPRKDVAKYYTVPGMPKRLILYGWDQAEPLGAAIVVEGVTDVWRLGPPAVALLGRTLSPMQLKRLADLERVLVALDGEVPVEEVREIATRIAGRGVPTVKVVRLPGRRDPADLTPQEVEKVKAALGGSRLWTTTGSSPSKDACPASACSDSRPS